MWKLSISLMFLTILSTSFRAGADQVKYLAYSEQALAAYALAIGSAKKSIDLATFIFEPCEPTGRLLLEMLEARARAGVHVRVLLDGFQQGEEQKRNFAATFANSGVEFKLFSNSIKDINTRLHEKFMVVDNAAYITGGRNLSDSYFGYSSIYNYVDRDAFVHGESAKEVSRTFNEIWNSSMSTAYAGSALDFAPWAEFCKDADLVFSPRLTQLRAYLNVKAPRDLASAPTRTCKQVVFYGDRPDFASERFGESWENGERAPSFLTTPRLGRKRATAAVASFLAKTNASLVAENWVYMPINGLEGSFAKLRNRSVPIEIFTNYDMEEEGPDVFREMKEVAILNATARDAVGTQTNRLISSLGSLNRATGYFALTPDRTRAFIHAKTLLRDRKDVLIGSFNLDSRSANINLESVVAVSDCAALGNDVARHHADLRRMYDFDQKSNAIPKRAEPDVLARILADLFISQL